MVKAFNKVPRVWMRRIRIEKGLTTREMAEIFGISYQHYSDIETGRRNPSEKLALKMSGAFREPVEKFFENRARFSEGEKNEN